MSESSSGIQIRLTPIRLIFLIIGLISLFWLIERVIPIKLPSLIPPAIDTKWSSPIPMGNINFLCHWNGIAVAMGRGGIFHILNKNGQWTEKTVLGFETEKNESCYPVIVDAYGPTAIFCDIKFTANKAGTITSFIKAAMTQPENITVAQISIQDYIRDLFKAPRSGQGFTRETALYCNEGAIQGSRLYVPYSAEDEEITMINTRRGPRRDVNTIRPTEYGFFYSADAGLSWQRSNLPIFTNGGFNIIVATSDQIHLLRTDYVKVWFFTQLFDASNWSKPKLLIDTVRSGQFLTEAEDDTLHLCWMDMRLKQGLGFFIYGDWDIGRANNQVFYRHYCKSKWSRERKLSGNLSHCENPSMSVEGKRIVVAWHNIETLYTRAAIYYATSKDNGQSWSRPTKIANSENVAGAYPCPKVILQDGIIYVFYNGIYQNRKFPD